MNKWDQYHKVSGLDIDSSKGTNLKRILINFRKRTNFLNKTIDRLLGIPLLPQDGIKVLDIGCGSGYTLMLLKEIYPGIKAYGVDIIKPEKFPEFIKFYKSDIEKDKLPFDDNFFDFILCRGVIEHLKNVTNLFHEAHRVLRKDGIVHILTENYTALFLPSCTFSQYTLNFLDDYTHIRPYTEKSLKRLLQTANFQNIKVKAPRNILIITAVPLFFLLQLAGKVDIGRLLFEIFAPDLFGEAKK